VTVRQGRALGFLAGKDLLERPEGGNHLSMRRKNKAMGFRSFSFLLAAGALAALLSGASAGAEEAGDGGAMGLRAALDGDHRSAEHKARDQYRHPQETLLFFGIRPDMAVVELWPGGRAWYTEVLAPFLKPEGTFYAAGYDLDSTTGYVTRSNAAFADKLASRPDIYGNVVVTELAEGKYAIAPEGAADMVLTFRNLHNWIEGGYIEAVFAAAYRALKPGGVFGVVEHRADPGTVQAEDPEAAFGYVSEERAIGLAEAAGFILEGRSEINANPKDTKDYPEGVWTLPPALTLEEKDQEKYLAIGESDRMTLKFVKRGP
jgi:predicted methyltransferase